MRGSEIWVPLDKRLGAGGSAKLRAGPLVSIREELYPDKGMF